MTASEVRRARERLSLTTRELAAKLGVTQRTVQIWQKEGAPAWLKLAIRGLEAETQKA